MRFRAEQHLRRPTEIRAVREQGRRVDCRAFTLWWKHRPVPNSPAIAAAPDRERAIPPTGARVCVIASTAAVGGAVSRNRAKRRLRAVFRNHQSAVPSDCDLLLIARSTVIEWPMAELEKKFSDACHKIQAEQSRA